MLRRAEPPAVGAGVTGMEAEIIPALFYADTERQRIVFCSSKAMQQFVLSRESVTGGQVSGTPVEYSGSIMSALQTLDPIRFTRDLVDIDSTTYHEGAVGDFLASFLESRGWAVEKTPVPQPPDSETNDARWNVYAGTAGETPELVFSTHMDTVPPFIPFSEDEEFIYGRGVCDAKGIIVAQVAAAERLRAEGYKIGVLFVSGEERDSAGAKAANAAPKASRFLVNGEPTDNRIALATKGALRASIRCSGKMAHSAYPELGDSAIHKMAVVMNRLLALDLPVDPEVGDTTLNIGQIHGGHAPNVIADSAVAQVLTRLVGPSQPVREAIVKAVGDLGTVEFTLDLAFVKLRSVEGLPTMVARFATDIPELSNWGVPVLLGPGSIHVAHTPGEKLSKRELAECIELYVQVAKQLLAS